MAVAGRTSDSRETRSSRYSDSSSGHLTSRRGILEVGTALTASKPIQEGVEEIARELAPDVVSIRSSPGLDWSEHPAMGLADNLLGQADHVGPITLLCGKLATALATQVRQSLRRAVSTAYDAQVYGALFQLPIEDAASRWDGSGEARSGLERAFTHGSMKHYQETRGFLKTNFEATFVL